MIFKINHSYCNFLLRLKRNCNDIVSLKIFVNHFRAGCKSIQSMNQIKQSAAVTDPDTFSVIKYIQGFFRKISGIKFTLPK